MLCNVCLRMSQAALGRKPECGDHHQTLVSLLDAAEAGCYICEYARQRLLEIDNRDNCQMGKFEFRPYNIRNETMVHLNMKLYHNQKEDSESIWFEATPTRGIDPTMGEKIRRRKGCIPEGEAVIKIREWMDLCLRDHEGTICRKSVMQTTSYPSRLLELGPSSFRVLRTLVEKPRGPYAALSYCWGPKPEFLRLTAGNESELEAGVSISRLPLAFQEAISVTQALSIRYIWIDSLCIIQSGPGSTQDWDIESPRMHQVYADSILTLALTCAASPSESILNQAHTQKTAMPPFEIKADSGHQDPTAGALTIVPSAYFRHTLYELPLSCRAWALQERVMATRVVSFGSGELFWDCDQLPNASESIPDGLQATQIKHGLGALRLARKAVPDGSDNRALLDTWWDLLEEYTKRRLTYPKKDRLVALSALAHGIGQALVDDVYIAGHFWKTLPLSLNWVLGDSRESPLGRYGGKARRLFWSEKPGAHDIGPRKPSWSWASLDGPVFFRVSVGSCQRHLAEAVSYTRELVNAADPTGPCISASISIRAYCTELEWQSQNEFAMVARTEAWVCDNIRLDVDLDEPEVIRVKGTKSLMLALKESTWMSKWEGLVVEEVTRAHRVTYRRIGHFVISVGNFRGSTWWDERFSIFGGDKKLVELV